MGATAGYDHVQRGKLHWLILLAGAGAAAGGLAFGDFEDGAPRLVLLVVGVLMALFSTSIFWLRVRDDGDALLVSFGPLPMFRRRVRYQGITGVERGRSLVIEGWGIHFLPGRGWTWNLWGRDTVVVQLGDRTLRIGTDDPVGLLRFLEQRLQDRPGKTS
jgi:hypothetical protein